MSGNESEPRVVDGQNAQISESKTQKKNLKILKIHIKKN